MNNNYKKILSAVTSLALLVSLNSCTSKNNNSSVHIVNPDTEINLNIKQRSTLEEMEKQNWHEFIKKEDMYKINIEEMLKQAYLFNDKVMNNEDIKALIYAIKLNLGEDIYIKEINDDKKIDLYNLKGESVTIYVNDDKSISLSFYFKENAYILNTISLSVFYNQTGETNYVDYQENKSDLSTGAYSTVNYRNNIQKYIAVSYKINSDRNITIYLYEDKIVLSNNEGKFSFKINKNEYNILNDSINKAYLDNDLNEFIIENMELLKEYLSSIKDKNPDNYNLFINDINKYTKDFMKLQLI